MMIPVLPETGIQHRPQSNEQQQLSSTIISNPTTNAKKTSTIDNNKNTHDATLSVLYNIEDECQEMTMKCTSSVSIADVDAARAKAKAARDLVKYYTNQHSKFEKKKDCLLQQNEYYNNTQVVIQKQQQKRYNTNYNKSLWNVDDAYNPENVKDEEDKNNYNEMGISTNLRDLDNDNIDLIDNLDVDVDDDDNDVLIYSKDEEGMNNIVESMKEEKKEHDIIDDGNDVNKNNDSIHFDTTLPTRQQQLVQQQDTLELPLPQSQINGTFLLIEEDENEIHDNNLYSNDYNESSYPNEQNAQYHDESNHDHYSDQQHSSSSPPLSGINNNDEMSILRAQLIAAEEDAQSALEIAREGESSRIMAEQYLQRALDEIEYLRNEKELWLSQQEQEQQQQHDLKEEGGRLVDENGVNVSSPPIMLQQQQLPSPRRRTNDDKDKIMVQAGRDVLLCSSKNRNTSNHGDDGNDDQNNAYLLSAVKRASDKRRKFLELLRCNDDNNSTDETASTTQPPPIPSTTMIDLNNESKIILNEGIKVKGNNNKNNEKETIQQLRQIHHNIYRTIKNSEIKLNTIGIGNDRYHQSITKNGDTFINNNNNTTTTTTTTTTSHDEVMGRCSSGNDDGGNDCYGFVNGDNGNSDNNKDNNKKNHKNNDKSSSTEKIDVSSNNNNLEEIIRIYCTLVETKLVKDEKERGELVSFIEHLERSVLGGDDDIGVSGGVA